MLRALREVGAAGTLDALASRVGADAGPTAMSDVARLLPGLRAAGADAEARTILARDPVGQLGDMYPPDIAELLDALHAAGDEAAVRALAAKVEELPFYYLVGAPELARALRTAGATDVLNALSARAATEIGIDNPVAVVDLLGELRDAGSSQAVQALLDRSPADHVVLDDPWAVANLLDALRAAGAGQEVQALAARAASGVPLGDPRSVARLLEALRQAGAADAQRALALRAADAGMFGLFLEVWPDGVAAYRFGRQPDGTPSPPWTWSEPVGG